MEAWRMAGVVVRRSLQTPSGGDEQHAKAAVGVALAGTDEVPEPTAAELWRPVPGTAAQHALGAGTSRRVEYRAVLVIMRIVTVLTPLPHIAMHVIQSPGVRLQLAHTLGAAVRVIFVPGVIL